MRAPLLVVDRLSRLRCLFCARLCLPRTHRHRTRCLPFHAFLPPHLRAYLLAIRCYCHSYCTTCLTLPCRCRALQHTACAYWLRSRCPAAFRHLPLRATAACLYTLFLPWPLPRACLPVPARCCRAHLPLCLPRFACHLPRTPAARTAALRTVRARAAACCLLRAAMRTAVFHLPSLSGLTRCVIRDVAVAFCIFAFLSCWTVRCLAASRHDAITSIPFSP